MSGVLTRRRLHLVLALLLPLLALRALLPTGYMPVTEGGELRFALCSAGLAGPATDEAPAGDQQLPPNSDSCPFALASAMAPPPVATWHAPVLQAATGPVVPRSAPLARPSIDRAQTPRGPPVLSI